MNKKVLLILADGLRPDALAACGHPYGIRLTELGCCCLETETVYPSVTLPCHMSLFHSVDPGRHGILTNTYVPQVRPVNGLCEQLNAAGKTCAFFYNWEELRDLSRPSSLAYSYFVSGGVYTYEKANEMVPPTPFPLSGKKNRILHSFTWGLPTAQDISMAGWAKNTYRPAASPWMKYKCLRKALWMNTQL